MSLVFPVLPGVADGCEDWFLESCGQAGIGGIDGKITMFFLFLPHRVVLRQM